MYKRQDEAKTNAEEIVLKALLGDNPSEETKEKFRLMLRDNQLNNKEIERALDQKSNPFQSLDIPGMPGAQMGMINMNDIFGKGLKNKKKTKLKIGEASPIFSFVFFLFFKPLPNISFILIIPI